MQYAVPQLQSLASPKRYPKAALTKQWPSFNQINSLNPGGQFISNEKMQCTLCDVIMAAALDSSVHTVWSMCISKCLTRQDRDVGEGPFVPGCYAGYAYCPKKLPAAVTSTIPHLNSLLTIILILSYYKKRRSIGFLVYISFSNLRNLTKNFCIWTYPPGSKAKRNPLINFQVSGNPCLPINRESMEKKCAIHPLEWWSECLLYRRLKSSLVSWCWL